MSDKKISEHILRLSGKVTLLDPVEVSKNYKIEIEGSITSEELKDNHDGTYTMVSKIEPVRVILTKETGETIKAKDPRSNSKLWKSLLWARWKEDNHDVSDEEFYDIVCNWERRHADDVIERAFRER